MRKMRVYLDTSVFGGVNDEEFAEPSRRFLARLKSGEFTVVISTELLRELGSAPMTVRKELDDIPDELLENAAVDPRVEALADAYVASGVLGETSRSDAIHVATATVAEADVIVSWNFKHIVNYNRIRKYNAINVLQGFKPIEILSPAEMAYGDET
jgi:predicted nucleic acid-binding protein